jgi:hypothetical protein
MLILIIPMLLSIFLLLVFLFIARNYIKKFSHQPERKSNEILPILISSNQTTQQILSSRISHHSYSVNIYSSTIDHQYESINQLLSIFSQLILLMFLFLSTFSIYLHPLYSFKLRFEDIIYSHLYGFFVLFLAFYILSFNVLSRFRLILRYYSHRKKDNHLSDQSSINSMSNNIPAYTEQISALPSSHTHDSFNKYSCQTSQNTIMNDEHVCASKRSTNMTSKYYLSHHHILKTNSTQNIPNDTLPLSSSDTISQK